MRWTIFLKNRKAKTQNTTSQTTSDESGSAWAGQSGCEVTSRSRISWRAGGRHSRELAGAGHGGSHPRRLPGSLPGRTQALPQPQQHLSPGGHAGQAARPPSPAPAGTPSAPGQEAGGAGGPSACAGHQQTTPCFIMWRWKATRWAPGVSSRPSRACGLQGGQWGTSPLLCSHPCSPGAAAPQARRPLGLPAPQQPCSSGSPALWPPCSSGTPAPQQPCSSGTPAARPPCSSASLCSDSLPGVPTGYTALPGATAPPPQTTSWDCPLPQLLALSSVLCLGSRKSLVSYLLKPVDFPARIFLPS